MSVGIRWTTVTSMPLRESPSRGSWTFAQKLQVWELAFKSAAVVSALLGAAALYSDYNEKQQKHQAEIADGQEKIEKDRRQHVIDMEKLRWEREKESAQHRKAFGLEQYKKKMELYHDVCKITATIATAKDRFDAESDIRRFFVLYHGNLCMVENTPVIRCQVAFCKAVEKWKGGPPNGLDELSQDLAKSCRAHLELLDEERMDQYFGEALDRLQKLAAGRGITLTGGDEQIKRKYVGENEAIEFEFKIQKGKQYWLIAAGDRLKVTTPLGAVVGIDPTHRIAKGAKVRVSIRPEDLSPLEPPGGSVPVNAFEGLLTFAIFAGTAVEAEVSCQDTTLQCLLNREADLTPGRAITLRARADACLVLPEE